MKGSPSLERALLHVRDIDVSTSCALAKADAPEWIALDPFGTRLAVAIRNRVNLYALGTGKRTATIRPLLPAGIRMADRDQSRVVFPEPLTQLLFSPDGRTLIVSAKHHQSSKAAHGSHTTLVCDVPRGKRGREVVYAPEEKRALAVLRGFFPNGDAFYEARYPDLDSDWLLRSWDCRSVERTDHLPPDAAIASVDLLVDAKLSADGRWLVVMTGSRLEWRDARTLACAKVVSLRSSQCSAPLFIDADGAVALAVARYDYEPPHGVHIVTMDGRCKVVRAEMMDLTATILWASAPDKLALWRHEGGSLELQDLTSGRMTLLRGDGLALRRGVVASATGSHVAWIEGQMVRCWETGIRACSSPRARRRPRGARRRRAPASTPRRRRRP